ncbi:MAG: cell division ATP-binding protein FtsE [Oscillospiraceae bacterium]
MIEFVNVSKSYDKNLLALDNVSLKVEKSEFVFVVGASGAGKSTLLKLLLREELPSAGKIFVDNVDVGKLKRRQIPFYRRGIGVVFQDFRLIDTMTVYDNVAFSLRVTNVPTKVIKRQVPYVLDLVGLLSKAKRFPQQLSGGEQQRVALARALVNNPSLIIADEPTGNVDPAMSLEIVGLLTEINRCGTTVIMVTHEHSLVTKFGHRTLILENGRVAADKRTEANYAR